MITNSTDNHVRSTLTGVVIPMTIAAGAKGAAKLMSILTNLYKDQILAIIREYSANALDAHISAGQKRPIEITIPVNRMQEAVVVIKDFGTGLSVSDIEGIYSQYGNSTKDDSNDFTGAFGLGCKSALSRYDQFTLVAVKDGVKATVVVTRNDDNGGSMTVVDTCATDEDNGVEVRIPIDPQDFYTFDARARHFFRFWDPETVLINGEKPSPLEGLKLAEGMTLVDDGSINCDYIVMGAVPYPTDKLNLGLPHRSHLVVTVPLGVMEPVPSREALLENSDFRTGVEAIREAFDIYVVDAIQADIDAAETHMEALQTMLRWHRKVPQRLRPDDGYVYKGTKLPLRMETPKDTTWFRVPGSYSKLSENDRIESYAAEQWEKTYWIDGFDKAAWTATMRKKLNHWFDEQGIGYIGSHNFVISDKRIRSPFIEKDKRIKWETINAVKLPRTVGTRAGDSGRIPGSYDLYIGNTKHYGVPADDIDTDSPIYYYNSTHSSGLGVHIVAADNPDCTTVPLQANRIDKFRRNFPQARLLDAAAREISDKIKASITDEEKLTLAYQNLPSEIGTLDPDRVDDPDVQDVILYMGVDTSELKAKLSNCWGSVDLPPLKNPMDKYPLLRNRYYCVGYRIDTDGDREHAYIYMNAVYADIVAKREAREALEAAHAEALEMDAALMDTPTSLEVAA